MIALDAGTVFLTVPPALGSVTRLRQTRGRVIAETSSGVPMIVPMQNGETVETQFWQPFAAPEWVF